MKNRVLSENYYLHGNLERQIGAFVDDDNQRYHESLNNLTLQVSIRWAIFLNAGVNRRSCESHGLRYGTRRLVSKAARKFSSVNQ